MYKKIPVHEVSIDTIVGSEVEPRIDEQPMQLAIIQREELANSFTGTKREVVTRLMRGDNFHEIARELKMKNSQIYTMRHELRTDFAWLYDEAKKNGFIEDNTHEINTFMKEVVNGSRELKLSQFQEIYINDYDPEAQTKSWCNVPLQDVYEEIWNTHQKSITKAPRDHLKTSSVIAFLVKKMFERSFPLEVTYFHLSKEIAIEKIRKIQMIIERNPTLSANMQIDQVKNWKDGEIRLLDGTTIQAAGWLQGTVGKHPHIVIMDDVIDISVVYSDVKNDRSIRKFYSEVYPMISRMSEEKKIIVIGTSQREDDLYEKLPPDFHRTQFAAVDEQAETTLEPALFTYPQLMKIKSDISFQFGEKYWLKEYQNVPFSAMGMIIKEDWIKTYSTPPDRSKMEILQAWDLAPGKKVDTGDWTAGATVGILTDEEENIRIYVLDIYRARIPFAERLKAIVAKANDWNPKKIGVEDNVFQYDTVSTLKKQTNLPIVGVTSVTNKIESFQVDLAPHFENGKIYLRADMEDLKQELLSLPIGKHDDMCDAIKIAIKLSTTKVKEPRIRMI